MVNTSSHTKAPEKTAATSPVKFTFFGSAIFSVIVLDEMKKAGFIPSLIITTPDKPRGRKLVITPTEVKEWALAQTPPISVLDPAKLDADFIGTLKDLVENKETGDVFVVAAYGKIIPQALLDLPPRKTLNIHPSLLPQYRGAAPLQSAILNDTKNTGVTIMRIDELMDHGPIVAQINTPVTEWDTYEVFEKNMAEKGARLLVKILPDWVAGKISETEQNHATATNTKKITKENGEISLDAIRGIENGSLELKKQYEVFRKIQAYHLWPTSYFFTEAKTRVKITDASWGNDAGLIINKVVHEGKPEIAFSVFVANGGLK